MRSLTGAITDGRVTALAVSLDIVNAFNTLLWGKIVEELHAHNVPAYLIAIISDYFRDRALEFRCKGGHCNRSVWCDVPQGSFLGSLLWNIYDAVFGGALLSGCHLVCYVDDTLVVTAGRNWDAAVMSDAMRAALHRRTGAEGIPS